MPADNVTPFRRPPPKRPPAPQQEGWGFRTHRGKAVLAHLLTVAAFVLSLMFPLPPMSFVALAAAVAAFLFVYSNRGAAMPWANTHHEHALRTLVIGYSILTLLSLLGMVVNTPLSLEQVRSGVSLFAFWAGLATVLWALLRALIALVLAVLRRPVWHPRGWFV